MQPLLRWQIGDVSITRVEETVTPVRPDVLVSDLDQTHIDAQRPWVGPYFTPDGDLLLSVHSFVVESAGTTVVVDTCRGTEGDHPLPVDPGFLDRLGQAIEGGIDAVDVVLCTHLHFDHVGWNTVVDAAGTRAPTFANARYLVTRDELDGFGGRDRDELDALAVQPLVDAGVLDPVETDHRITPEVRLVATPGHTPGHVSVLIESGDRSGLITGDAVHSPIQFTYPELAAARFDFDHEMSTHTRLRLIEEYLGSDTLLLGTHFAPPTAGLLRRDDGGNVFFE
jgi:glyoxylase-like metal-dependent hydrolase (beta-lactamase superfamily II)